MPLTTRNSKLLPSGARILNHVGNEAPPRPTMPESRTQEINSSLVVYSGALSAGSASILPSETISTTGAVAPVGSCSVATLVTVPETLAWIGEPSPST